MENRRGFTMIELLTTIAIVAILAAILLPVFTAAKDSARKSTCQSNLRQVSIAMALYLQDYDDRFAPPNYRIASDSSAENDRTWVQVLLPYVRSFTVFKCPSDYSKRKDPHATFDEDLVIGDTYSIYYKASQRSNVGYNYAYLAPLVRTRGQSPFTADTRSYAMVAEPARTIGFLDSVWSISSRGVPSGGGAYLVTPPCRYLDSGSGKIDTWSSQGGTTYEVYQFGNGWTMGEDGSKPEYGGAYPWHSGAQMNVVMVGGNARPQTPAQLAAGCRVLPNWIGNITNLSDYAWDLN